MKSYSERKIFPPLHLSLYRRAAELVAEIDLTRLVLGEELRCHELARAVHMRLCVENYPLEFSDRFEVVDGRSGIVEHSWLELETKGFRSIIDPYAVG